MAHRLRRTASVALFWVGLVYCLVGTSPVDDSFGSTIWRGEGEPIGIELTSAAPTLRYLVVGGKEEPELGDDMQVGARLQVAPGAFASVRLTWVDDEDLTLSESSTQIEASVGADIELVAGVPFENEFGRRNFDAVSTPRATLIISLDGGGPVSANLIGTVDIRVRDHGHEDNDPHGTVEVTEL